MEETALKLSSEATRRLDRREMAASGAPLHSFYLNYVSLDRYRRLGVNFLFNSNAKLFHYDGANWQEIVKKFPKSTEVVEAQKRLDSLKEKMEALK
jgi:thymidylate kinase